jgi:DNA-binding transcriptional LysR family regulator
MDLRQLLFFVTLAEERHFSRASERLRMNKSTLSRQIKTLESDLGVTLLERHTRSVVLTKPGIVMLAEAKNILALVPKAIVAARKVSRSRHIRKPSTHKRKT